MYGNGNYAEVWNLGMEHDHVLRYTTLGLWITWN